MGRSLEVRRKSENLPVVGCTWFVFSRAGTRLWLLHPGFSGLLKRLLIEKEDRRFSREDGGFFIGVRVAGILPAIRGRDALDTGSDQTEGGE